MANSRHTMQREIVLREIRQSRGHATAEMLYARIHAAHPLISKATVYRNLKALEQQGKIMRIPVPGGADYFEAQTSAHYHIQCTCCGRIFDASLPYMPHLLELEQEADKDFTLFACDVLFAGLCPDCKQSNTTDENPKQGGTDDV